MKPEKFAELMERMHGIPVSVSMQRLRKATESDPSFSMRSKQIGGSGSAASSFGMRVKLNPTANDVEQKTSDASIADNKVNTKRLADMFSQCIQILTWTLIRLTQKQIKN
ncbi:hypothetical protein EBS67_00595 [bacterium]|nr:hypothetical protein [bacterium]